MTSEERDLINGLFDRLKNTTPAAKDAEAQQLIQRQVASNPDAAYCLVQTLLVQEHALQNAQLRINQLQQQIAAPAAAQQGGGGFLSGLFHRDQPVGGPPPLPSFPTTAAMGPSSGGGFLRGALATAAGVAGGSLLFQGIEDLLGHRAGAFGPMLGGFGGGGGMMPQDNVEVINNYFGGDAQPPVQGGSFLQTGAGFPDDPSLQGIDPGAGIDPGLGLGNDPGLGGNDPGLGVDWGSNIDPGGSGSGNMAV